jgi:hypothetical protein
MLKMIGIISSIGIITSTVVASFIVGYINELFDTNLHNVW